MSKLKALLFTWMFGLALGAHAAPVFLDFEDTPLSSEPSLVGDAYASLGVNFTGDAYRAISNNVCVDAGCTEGGWGSFIGSAAAPMSDIGAVILATPGYVTPGGAGCTAVNCASFTMAVSGGFGTLFSVDVGGSADATMEAFDANGKLLASENIDGLNQLCGGEVCSWTLFSLDLTDMTASSIVITSSADGADWFDNMTFGALPSAPPGGGTGLPEPSDVALALAGFGALAISRRRRVR